MHLREADVVPGNVIGRTSRLPWRRQQPDGARRLVIIEPIRRGRATSGLLVLLLLGWTAGEAQAAKDPLRASQWHLDAVHADDAQRISHAKDPLRASQWYLDAVHADDAQRVSQGNGITVAVLDTGVDTSHPDLAGSVLKGPDLVDGDNDPNDENGHGTAVAGIIGARARNGVGIRGAAPGVRLLAIRVLDAHKVGTTDIVARGIDAAVAGGAKVINLSLTVPSALAGILVPGSAIVQAIERAVDAGVVVVTAAGNDAQPICAQPLLTRKILCVGAVNRQQQRSSYSNYGLRVDMVAPGGELDSEQNAIMSTRRGGGYVAVAGTSEATPQVSSAAALLMSLGLSASQTIDRILATATDLGPAGPDFTYGRGMLNMAAAVSGLGSPAASSLAPSPYASDSCRAPRRVAIRTLIARGLRVRCRMATTGRRRARLVTLDGRTLGQTNRRLRANVRVTWAVRLNVRGRRTMRRTKRRSLVCRVLRVGAPPIVLRIRIHQ